MTKNLTTDQKIDVLLSEFSVFRKELHEFEVKLDKMQSDITDLIELTSSATNIATVTSDRVDKLENKKSFTNLESGAFVA